MDWLHDQCREEGAITHESVTYLLGAMREDGRVIMRRADVEALVSCARDEGLDPEDEDQWNDDPEDNTVLLALANWAKERRDWET